MLRRSQSNNLVIVADSGFGSNSLLQELKLLGISAVFSMSANECSFVWELLKRGVHKGEWNACGTEEGVMLSVHQGAAVRDDWSGNSPFHLLGTNCFSFQISELNRNADSQILLVSPLMIMLKNEFVRMELPLFRRMVAEELLESRTCLN